MLYTIETIEVPIEYHMNAKDIRESVAYGIRQALSTGNEVRFCKGCSIWKSGGVNLVLECYGYNPYKVNIKDMTFEDLVDEVMNAFNFND